MPSRNSEVCAKATRSVVEIDGTTEVEGDGLLDQRASKALPGGRRDSRAIGLFPEQQTIAILVEAPGYLQRALGHRDASVLRGIGHHLVQQQGEDPERVLGQSDCGTVDQKAVREMSKA